MKNQKAITKKKDQFLVIKGGEIILNDFNGETEKIMQEFDINGLGGNYLLLNNLKCSEFC